MTVVLPWLEPGALIKSAGHFCVFTLKLYAFLCLDTLFLVRMFDRANITNQIGQLDQTIRRMATGDDNVQHLAALTEYIEVAKFRCSRPGRIFLMR